MKKHRRYFWLLTVLALILPIIAINGTAEPVTSEMFMFIDGENILRQTNTAIIYTGDKITLNSRGHDVVVDGEGIVTEIYEGTIDDDRNIDIPEGGMVISAVGTANKWLKDNISEGKRVFYDSYTQKLFLCDEFGSFDPYFTRQFAVTTTGSDYKMTDGENENNALKYSYGIAVDANGIIVAKGDTENVPEGGYILRAGTDEYRKQLTMFAVVGGSCTIADGYATLSYDSTMLSRTAELVFETSTAMVSNAKLNFADIDIAEAEAVIDAAKAKLGIAADESSAVESAEETSDILPVEFDYASLMEFVTRLEKDIESACAEKEISQLRGAFHTPDETTAEQIRDTVKSAKNAGLNTIVLRLSNSVGTFIPLPTSFPFEQDEKFGGFDVLQSYIDICAEEKMELTLCIDVYYNKYASAANKEWVAENEDITVGDISDTADAKIVTSESEETGLIGRYYSPGSEDYKEYFLSYVEYIVTHYSVNSIMFDYLRYPKFSETTDIGYDDETMTAFSRYIKQPINEVYKIRNQLFDSPYWTDWVEFRKSLVDGMAKSISETVKKHRSDITLLAVAARDSVDYYYMQNPGHWIEEGWMDGICVALFESDKAENDPVPMLGYYDNMVAEKTKLFAAHTSDEAYLFAGIESSAALTHEAVAKAISYGRSNGSEGFIFSNLEDYLTQNYYSYLSGNVMKTDSVSPLGDTAENMKTVLEFAKSKINDRIFPAGGCDKASADSGTEEIDKYLALIGENGLTFEQASELQSDMAMIFASSGAKSEILEEFETIKKLALLSKGKAQEIIPPADVPDEKPETGDESDISEESSAESQSIPAAPSYSPKGEEKRNVDIGSILIYVFVGVSMVAAVFGIIIAARRNKETRPVNRHMNKPDNTQEKNKND